ncbi:MAG TPA: hypothetical protein PLV93_07715 [Microthrixaceae bacterium]|nr:hypothetical protein [Microthrixaceae bacterium]HNI35271.1 hypothetical protein [Microthrixaceae bacterium]
MSWLIERRLRSVGRRLAQAREELAIAEEQLVHFADEASDAELRSIVSEAPGEALDGRSARRHSDAMARHRDELRERITRLETAQDLLLDQLSARSGS